ncbi:MAG: D-alanyl-D-alanine dipeptidase [Cyanobacteria bacterium RI_101]|nr:D-alanyl-D-alanine dipeptidase [Cyanobacteria bacterium RI_101]
MNVKPYLQIPIQDCGEPLVPIDCPLVQLTLPPPYQQLGADYGGQSPYVLRSGVLAALSQAQSALSQEKPGWKLRIFDAYRPVAAQQFMVDYTFRQILERDGLDPSALGAAQREEILAEVYTIWALPSLDPLTPPPHSTGAAVDLTLTDEADQVVEMGGEIDELSPRSRPDYYDQSADPKASLFRANRELLNRVMTGAGFLRHPGEWWHFSLGDQLWAWQMKERYPRENFRARYGRAE